MLAGDCNMRLSFSRVLRLPWTVVYRSCDLSVLRVVRMLLKPGLACVGKSPPGFFVEAYWSFCPARLT